MLDSVTLSVSAVQAWVDEGTVRLVSAADVKILKFVLCLLEVFLVLVLNAGNTDHRGVCMGTDNHSLKQALFATISSLLGICPEVLAEMYCNMTQCV